MYNICMYTRYPSYTDAQFSILSALECNGESEENYFYAQSVKILKNSP